MKILVPVLGALVALFSFSTWNMAPTPRFAADTIGSTVGYVYPTNTPPCAANAPRQADPALPKNVPHATWYNVDAPPLRYRKDAKVKVYFESPEKIETDQTENRPCSGTVFAYQVDKELHLPNPCRYPKSDPYAKLVCHELGHLNGWPGYHGD